jgi:hypothetical protein
MCCKDVRAQSAQNNTSLAQRTDAAGEAAMRTHEITKNKRQHHKNIK